VAGHPMWPKEVAEPPLHFFFLKKYENIKKKIKKIKKKYGGPCR